MSKWKDMRSAPKDGTVILAVHNRGTWIYPKDQQRINCVVVFWSMDKFNEFGPDSFYEEELDYWMPIEIPPNRRKK